MTRKNKPPMVRHLPITKARINLGAVVRQVHLNKEYVVLEKDGIPIAALMDAEEFEDYLELRDPEVKRHIAASTKEYREGKSFPAEDLIAESKEKGGAGRGRRR
jgi:PHD/YefM family antitoxin component YafN of YafNO toxin-antitoxin module